MILVWRGKIRLKFEPKKCEANFFVSAPIEINNHFSINQINQINQSLF